MKSEVFAPAKINLTLHVTGQRSDGYHLLDSLVVFADIGDTLTLSQADQISMIITGPFSAGVPVNDTNLVWRAVEHAGKKAAILLEKNLPNGAGIGGGSSDAAAVLRHYRKTEGAETLGADVPVCLNPTAQRMSGVGDVLEALPTFPSLHAVLINPGVHVATPDVFEGLKKKDNVPMPADLPAFAGARTCIKWLSLQRNDLQGPAIKAAPVIRDVIKALEETEGCRLSRMSGSGSTCFGLFTNAKHALAAAEGIAKDHPRWWVHPCKLN